MSEAKAAYFEGEFDRCLTVCAEIRVSSLVTASEVALLSARAYLRTGRPAEAESALAKTAHTHTSLDASLTAEMLFASARIRQEDADVGIAMLEAAAARAVDAHFAVRSEIAFATALGYWVKRDMDSAERYLARVDRRSDIIHARALELAAWCQTARGNYRRSADFFILTLLRLDSCHARDCAIVATAICTLSILGAELFDAEIARVAEHRARTMEWTSGLVTQQFLTLLHQALFAEVAGNTVEAYELAMRAREVAPNVAFEVSAWSVSSAIARNADETCAGAAYAARAQRLLDAVDLRELTGEQRFSILAAAESCAPFDLNGAARLFAAYWGLAPVDKMLALSGDPRLAAEETFVAAVIAEESGDVVGAVRCFRQAFTSFDRLSYVRRALMAACALVRLDDDEAMRRYAQAHSNRTPNYLAPSIAPPSPDSNRFAAIAKNPIFMRLPPSQREVVMLMCQGKSNREIAASRKVGEQTIKNLLSKHVFRAFGVSSRAALVSACLSAPENVRSEADATAPTVLEPGTVSRRLRTKKAAVDQPDRSLTFFTRA